MPHIFYTSFIRLRLDYYAVYTVYHLLLKKIVREMLYSELKINKAIDLKMGIIFIGIKYYEFIFKQCVYTNI